MKITLGVVIALILIFFWYRQDHPEAFQKTPAAPATSQTAPAPGTAL